jgi:hypothetical protein
MTLTPRTFQEGMTRLAVAFDAKADEAKIAVYWEELSDLSDEAFAFAVKRALREWEKPFALPTLGFLRARCPQPLGSTSDEAAALLKRKIGTFAAETRPEVGLSDAERELVRDLAQTIPRLAMMPLTDLDKWLTWQYRPAWERRMGRAGDGDQLLGVGHRPALLGGDER